MTYFLTQIKLSQNCKKFSRIPFLKDKKHDIIKSWHFFIKLTRLKKGG
ncbi:hypothetical protein [Campylobacter sp.]|nr:hypothetical protein [Campylobacter sp.]MDD7090904.1 hypothetical protein [Campylobacteraceae bacterium]